MSDKEEKTKNISIDFFDGLCGIVLILSVLSCVGTPDLLDQLIAIAKNYSETIKCK